MKNNIFILSLCLFIFLLTGACENPFWPEKYIKYTENAEKGNGNENENGNKSIISNAKLFIVSPTLGVNPANTATTEDIGYVCGAVSWSPEHNPFLGSNVYTASVTLTANSNYLFSDELSANVNNHAAEIISNTGNTVTLSYEFAPTLNKAVVNLSIKQQHSNLNYIHNDVLDLTGLEVTLTYDDTTTDHIELDDFINYNITTYPAHGDTLSHSSHHDKHVEVIYGVLTAKTHNLIVNKITPTIDFPIASSVIYGALLSTSSLTGGSIEFGSFSWVNGDIKPTVSNSGYDVVFTPNDSINYDYSGIQGWNHVSGKINRKIAIDVFPALLSEAAVTITAPVKNAVPNTTASSKGNFTISQVTWSPNNNPFLGDTVYTAAVTLTANENYKFNNDIEALINNENASVKNKTENTIEISYTFPKTLNKVVQNISIKSQPKLQYTHGEHLNLSELEVVLTFDDETTRPVSFVDFHNMSISTNLTNDTILNRSSHDNQPIKVSFGELSVNTNNLTINKADPFVTWPTSTPITYGAALSTSAFIGGSGAGTFTWTNGSVIPPVNNSGYQVTFTPNETNNYNTLTHDVNITVNRANPSVTWPSGLTADYGQTLTNISLSGKGSSSVVGIFSWVTLGDKVGNAGTQSHIMQFTPNDTANFNILTQNVNIAVSKINPSVTWPTGLTAVYGQTLSNISLLGNGTSPVAGTFSWVSPQNSVGIVGTRSHDIRFTPNDTGNYNTLTQSVNIIVSKANGLPVNAPVVSSISSNSITVTPVSVTGNVQSVQYAISTAGNGTGLSAWQSSTTFTSLSNTSTYYIYARTAENNNYFAGTQSGASQPITLQTFSVNVAEITNPEITVINSGLVIYRSGGTAIGTITVQNASGYSIEWWYDDYLLKSGINANTLELSSSDLRYNMTGKKFITIIVTIDGKPYSKRIWFEVR